MSEVDPHQSGPDELFLSGRLQVDTPIDVLSMTGINPQVEGSLRVARKLHELVTTPGAKDDLCVYLQDDLVKADIATSALLAERNQSLPPGACIAARGLLDVLGIEI